VRLRERIGGVGSLGVRADEHPQSCPVGLQRYRPKTSIAIPCEPRLEHVGGDGQGPFDIRGDHKLLKAADTISVPGPRRSGVSEDMFGSFQEEAKLVGERVLRDERRPHRGCGRHAFDRSVLTHGREG